MLSPGDFRRHGRARGPPRKPPVEADGRDDEDTESHDLSNETDVNDGFGSVYSVLVGFRTV